MTESQTLLAEFAKRGSETAFRELVARYIDLVYSTAVRLVEGDAHAAQDVAQMVFMDLARAAKSLSGEVRLGGWLHRHTCFVAAKTLRGERRRHIRERQAVEMNDQTDHFQARLAEVAPILDEAINQLGAADRAAVLLRFYERLDFRAVGEALGTNEAAAQKRVARALEKLHLLLKHKGVTMSAAALGAALSGEAVKAAPVGLAASVSGAAVAGTAAGMANTFTLLNLMATTKLKSGVMAAVIIASVAIPLLVQRQAQARLVEQDKALQRQSQQLAQLAAENQRLALVLAQTNTTSSQTDNQFREMLRLRGEVGRLKELLQKSRATKSPESMSPEEKIAALKQMYAVRVDRLKQWLQDHPSEQISTLDAAKYDTWLGATEQLADDATDEEYKRAASLLRGNADGEVFDKLFGALRKYGAANGGQFPTDLSQLAPYLASPIDPAVLQHFEIVAASSLIPELRPSGDWAITQVAAGDARSDSRSAYGLNDMHTVDESASNRWTFVPNQ